MARNLLALNVRVLYPGADYRDYEPRPLVTDGTSHPRPWQTDGTLRDPLEVRDPHARGAVQTHRRGPGWRAE